MTGRGAMPGPDGRGAIHPLRTASLMAVLLLGGHLARARAGEPLTGIFALPGGSPRVTATLRVTPDAGLRRTLDVAMTPIGATVPVTRYETELSKRLHVVAVSADLRDFVHEHGDAPAPDGHFRVAMRFPHAGPWHVYADGTPEGSAQQVMRFDVAVGRTTGTPLPDLGPTGLAAADDGYAARFDGLGLVAGREAHLSLHLLRDGRPAPDITPFLGVAAHAVFIDAADLSYVHVHAAPAGTAGAGGTAAATAHDMDGMAGMEGMGPPLPAGASVSPDLALHVRAPKAGTYVLWIQFNGGGKARTVRFVVPVRASDG